jgi:pyridinium-3,5-bisthiocarboxylic acid mononucleotide nickel chelatase
MKVLYVDAFAGISGDMTVGAFIDLGLSVEQLRQQLQQVALGDYTITATPCRVQGISATKFDVQVAAHGHGHRAFRDIRRMLEDSTLDAVARQHALAIFAKLAAAEAHVHGVAVDDVEFHEVGAVDSIVDIVGAAIGLQTFGIAQVYVSPLPLGAGIVPSQHGPLPVPGPATVELLRGFTTRPGDGEGELVTPTGAAILASTATAGPPPEMRVTAVGYGAGTRTLRDRPNLLRLVVGDALTPVGHDEHVVIETNIDDYNPELYAYVMERLFAAGAREVFLTPVHMKKNRPGVVLSIICAASERDQLAGIVMSETSAIGVRSYAVRRLVLTRASREVSTVYGTVRVKSAHSPDGYENLAPEYEDCKRLAREQQVPIKLVYQAAVAAALQSSRGHQ